MIYLKLFESYDDNVLEINKTIFNDIDILLSLEESLIEMGYEVFCTVNIGSARFDMFGFKDYIDSRIDIEIPTFSYNLAAACNNANEEELNQELDNFNNRIESMTKCRVDNISLNIERKYRKVFSGGDYKITDNKKIGLTIVLSNKKSRYD